MKKLVRPRLLLAATLCSLFLFSPRPVTAQTTEKFYFWVTGSASVLDGGACGRNSFVIEVDASKKAEIERFWAEKKIPQFRGHIVAGPADYNRNYHAPGHPVWNWHVSSVDEIAQIFGIPHDASIQPPRDGGACDIALNPADWIQKYGSVIGFEWYFIGPQIDPSKPDAMANVSNRGVAGAGERKLITGLIVTGGTPRNIVVRALGPSLSSAGVQQVAGNPKIEVYQNSNRIASNADWKSDARANAMAQSYPSLVPPNDKEAAVWLTLLPGTYTLHGSNEDGTEGIILLEAYDVDSNP
jgi:hypothetical protein